jgi:glutamine amidotransferase
MIVIIDYGMGNVGSIENMLKKIGVSDVLTSSSLEDIEKADKLILPGVGAFDNGMENIHKSGILDTLNKKVLTEKIPILGICLGMQLLTRNSEEGQAQGLGWIDAETVKFRFSGEQNLKVPHMGWNSVTIKQRNCPLSNNLHDDSRYYFVHSYFVRCSNPDNILFETSYGITFTSAVVKNNIYGVQFHPEKSHQYGKGLLRNFANL